MLENIGFFPHPDETLLQICTKLQIDKLQQRQDLYLQALSNGDGGNDAVLQLVVSNKIQQSFIIH